jgi:hypothetical protein
MSAYCQPTARLQCICRMLSIFPYLGNLIACLFQEEILDFPWSLSKSIAHHVCPGKSGLDETSQTGYLVIIPVLSAYRLPHDGAKLNRE